MLSVDAKRYSTVGYRILNVCDPGPAQGLSLIFTVLYEYLNATPIMIHVLKKGLPFESHSILILCDLAESSINHSN